ncbi:hypothetical protein IQ16_08434 [Bradyrhizobium huanghuaihaiense]|uniref:Uncharacterized protein n=1 Tax=Bradyrhizobium huanghuaihaiense TaxID=990078 RepID=A0A562QJQ7_9BRAD|nr:hypothetical protein IQ16_08434 [Bradyrhizobium huanghuaihaiense]
MHRDIRPSERGSDHSGNVGVSKSGDIVHNCVGVGGCKRSVKRSLIAKPIKPDGNIYRIDVSREEGGGAFEAMLLPACERQR